MHFPILALAFVLVATTTPTHAQNAASAKPLTVAEAMRLAESANPAVRTRQAQLAAVEGARREAAAPFFNNPELSLQRTRRSAEPPDGASADWSAGVSQTIEIGGQQTHRREAAAASLDALRAEIDDAQRQARAEAALRFYTVLAAQRRMRIEERSVELFDNTAQAVSKRRAAGEDTRLDANVALVEAERSRNALSRSREQWIAARSDLATTLQLPPSALPEVEGDVGAPGPGVAPYGLEQLLSSAQALPKQRALAAREAAARARLGTERASRLPDLVLGLNVGREGPGDARQRVTTLAVSLPLPLFKRNDAAIGQAMTEVSQAELDRASGSRDALAQVRQLWSRFGSQTERVQRLLRTVAPASTDNQQLAAKSRQAGQIGLLDQLIINRQALDAERDLNDALADYHATRIELEHAAGWPQTGLSQ
ncbi:MAG: TolC family protein [Rhodoferax sp.]|nr:TolC family protein [Rhodoferax sp.]